MKQLELQHFGVQELGALEMREIDGGKVPWKAIANGAKYLAKEIGIQAAAEVAGEYLSGFWDGLTG